MNEHARDPALNPTDLASILKHFEILWSFRAAISAVIVTIPTKPLTSLEVTEFLREIVKIQADPQFQPPGFEHRGPPPPPLKLVD